MTLTHGTMNAYNNRGCRCDACRAAKRELRKPADPATTSHELLMEVLQDMFPLGLTDDCPARKALRGETG
jgi:hypothetical protein